MSIPQTPSPLANILASKTYNAAWFSGPTKEQQITNAIAAAKADGALYVYIPANMLPYTASSVTFDTSVRMIREGGDPSVYDIKAYGADLLGSIDASVSCQKAFDAAAAALILDTPIIEPIGTIAGALSGSMPKINFPSGKYKITSAINIPAYCLIESDGKARITQYTASTDIFYGNGAIRIRLKGLVFVGGRHAVYYRNNNTDTSSFIVQECEFHAQSDYAVRLGDELGSGDCASCLAAIYDCGFYRPKRVLFTMCDNTSVNRSWVFVSKSNFDTNTAAFINKGGGNLIFDEMFGVPTMAYGGGGHMDNVRWVDNYGNFYSYNSRFGGEDAGMSIVRHFTAPAVVDPWLGGGVVEIHGGYVAAGPNTGTYSGVLGLQTNIPQMFLVEGTQGINAVPLINNIGISNLTTYLAALPAQTLGNIKYRFFWDNLSLAVGAIPTQLLPYFDTIEGIWSPVIKGSGTAGTYEIAVGYYAGYRKTGRQITLWAHLPLAAAITGGGTGNVRIDGLPFVMSTDYTGFGAASVNDIAFTGSQVVVERVSSAATSTIYLYGLSNAGTRTEIPIANVGVNDVIDFEFSYLI